MSMNNEQLSQSIGTETPTKTPLQQEAQLDQQPQQVESPEYIQNYNPPPSYPPHQQQPFMMYQPPQFFPNGVPPVNAPYNQYISQYYDPNFQIPGPFTPYNGVGAPMPYGGPYQASTYMNEMQQQNFYNQRQGNPNYYNNYNNHRQNYPNQQFPHQHPQHQNLHHPQQNSHQPPQSNGTPKKFSASTAKSFVPSNSHETYIKKPLQNAQTPSPSPLPQQPQQPSQSQPQEQQTSKQEQEDAHIPHLTDNDDSIRFITEFPKSSISSIYSSALTTINSTTKLDSSIKSSESKTNDDTLIFQVPDNNNVSLPLVFGTTLNKFLTQKKKFTKEEAEEPQLEQVSPKSASEETLKETTPSPSSPPTLASPISAAPLRGWSSIASKAVQKTTKSSSASPSTSNPNTPVNSSKREDNIKFVPTISNVLEPLGIVLLKLMFDKSFQKYSNKLKVPKIVPRGIVNTGNICFMSSILQLLLYCQPFYKDMTIISNKTLFQLNGESKTPLFDSIINFYKYFNIKPSDTNPAEEGGRKFGEAITPTELYQSISSNDRFQHLKWGQQEDAEEFFGYLLDGLHEEFISSVEKINDLELKNLLSSITSDETRLLIKQNIKKFHEDDLNSTNQNSSSSTPSTSKEFISDDGWTEVSNAKNAKISAKRTVEVKPSPIRQLFGGQFRSILNVPKQKESRSITLDPFQQIQLDISDDSIKTLEEAFLKISEIEEIPMKSSNGEDVIAKKQTFIDKLPEVLIIHLKRFSFNFNNTNKNGYYNRGRIEKLTKTIEYKHQLTIPSAIISPTNRSHVKDLNYKLTGVVYHIGSSSDGGHYIVDVLSDDGWISIDDTNISELSEEEVLGKDGVQSAYILMYQRV